MTKETAHITDRPSLGTLAMRAMVAEVLAPKAGNVHLFADFEDADWSDFMLSALAVRPVLDAAAERGVGQTVLDGVRATQSVVPHNTNLGMLLLLAPLCAVPRDQPFDNGHGDGQRVAGVLDGLTEQDATLVYEAIREASPGGLGDVDEADVRETPPPDLLEAMRLAADRDTVARQYVNGFADVRGLASLLGSLGRDTAMPLDQAIVMAHLQQMAREPDSLIRRKCGQAVAEESSRYANAVLDLGFVDSKPEAIDAFAEFDQWLREDGHRRNPGTSADLVAAAIFVALREDWIAWPARWDMPLV